MIIKPKDWESFQHYKDRSPPWIKLHKTLLNNYEYHSMSLASRALAPCFWLLASEYEGGEINVDPANIAWRLRCLDCENRLDIKMVESVIKELIDKGFFVLVQPASATLATELRDALLERETETEKEKETEREIECRESDAAPPSTTRSKAGKKVEQAVLDVIEHLNLRTGAKFTVADGNAKFIRGRLADGYTVDDIKSVVDAKVTEWGRDDKMRAYLRPKTLFSSENFSSYVGLAKAKFGPAAKKNPWEKYGLDAEGNIAGSGRTIDGEVIRRV